MVACFLDLVGFDLDQRAFSSWMMVEMKYSIRTIAFILLASGIAQAQQDPNRYQPYTPTVVGGLPPGSKGLEQPVYVAERAMGNQPVEFADSSKPEYLSASSLGFDANKAVPTTSSMELFDAGTLIAYVGDAPILIGDLFSPKKINAKIVGHSQFEMQTRKELLEIVTRKALAYRFVNDKMSGKPLKDRAEAKKQFETQTARMFHEKWIPMQMKEMKIESALEFQEKLAEAGKSLTTMQRDVGERMWAQELVREKVPEEPVIELSELSDYYNEHIDDFKRPARVRFQMLSAEFPKFQNKEAAFQAIVDMGNQILLGGAPFAAVAKRQSTGLGASDGGLFEWTTQGALKSKEIDKAIFENPVRGLSQIIENSTGYHIVEVLERDPAHTETFAQAQSDIRKKLTTEKVAKQRNDYIKKVREETPIYTKWPQDIPGSQDIKLIQQ